MQPIDELVIMSGDPVVMENLRILIATHVLDFRNGSIELHYGPDGRINKVLNHLASYKRNV